MGGTTWWPTRRRVAALALVTAALTGVSGAALGGTASHALGGALYVAVVAAALFAPAMIAVQVLVGGAMAAGLILTPGGLGPVTGLPLALTIVLTAELLGVAARLDTPVERDPTDDLRRAVVAVGVAGAAYGAVLVAAALPGPTGFAAVALASAACMVIALVILAAPGRGQSRS